MAPRTFARLDTVREEILAALRPAGTISATPRYLAQQLELPVRRVRDELDAMVLDGTAKRRQLRSGEILYRLKDRIDSAWERQNGLSTPLSSRSA